MYSLIRTLIATCLIVCVHHSVVAYNPKGNSDSLRLTANTEKPTTDEPNRYRTFSTLEAYYPNNGAPSNIPFNSAAPEFTADYIAKNFTVSAFMSDARAQAQATFDEVERKNRYTDYLSPNDLTELPIGLKKKMGNASVTIGISKAKFTKDYALLTVFCKIDLPEGKSIYLGADNIRLSRSGGILQGGANRDQPAKLVLLDKFPIPINGGNMMITLKGGTIDMSGGISDTEATSAILSCGGVESLNIVADVEFPRSLLTPLNEKLEAEKDKTKKVTGHITGKRITSWNEFVADVSIPTKFAITGFESIGFKVVGASFDLSDKDNPAGIRFPQGYNNITTGLWRGLYIKDITVYLPKAFKEKGNNNPVTFEAQDLIVDNAGISGKLLSTIPILKTGSASGWDFSVDNFELEIQTNTIRKIGFGGAIAIPLSKKTDDGDVKKYGLLYKAMMVSPDEYLFNVSIKEDLNFDIWRAKGKLTTGSSIKLTAKDGKFLPEAFLNGSLDVNILEPKVNASDPDKSNANFTGIKFEGLHLQTVNAPYIAGTFGYENTNNKLAYIPITINKAYLTAPEGTNIVNLTVDVDVKLMEQETNKFSAKATINVMGEFVKTEDDLKFEYKGLDVKKIAIDGDFGAFGIKGEIEFYEKHEIMGKGLAGEVDMHIKMAGKDIKTEVKVAFGNTTFNSTQEYRYWYVDVMVSGFTIPLGPVTLNGLGGGASYHMQKLTSLASTNVCPTGLGYIPDDKIGLGFRARTTFSLGSESVSTGDLALEMIFSATGGISKIGLYGKATILPRSSTHFQNPSNRAGEVFQNRCLLCCSTSSSLRK